MLDLLQLSIVNRPLDRWLIALAVGSAVFIVIRVVLRILISRLGIIAQKTATPLDDTAVDTLKHTNGWFLFVVAVYAGAILLDPSDRVAGYLKTLLIITLILQAGIWSGVVMTSSLDRYRERQLQKDPATVTALSAINFLGRLVIWSAVLLLILDNLGVNITALVAGLGVGGIAVALAVQNILGDIFASLSILIDKPFVVGDFLVVDDYMGAVQYVGLKTTRIRSLSGEQLIFANSDLLQSRLRNFGRMFERRVVFNIRVTYQTPREKLRKIPAIMQTAIEQQDKTRFDRAHFFRYADFSLSYEIVYFVLSPDYNLYMDIQQAINFHIHEQFEREGIEFAKTLIATGSE